jgi:GntR family transcriptional repressor for pyruvate dehydrogenase complex
MSGETDDAGTMTSRTPPLVTAPQKRLKRSDALAARIRDLISQNGLSPGDRIPQKWLEDEENRASKGTVREAMKSLETQGLIKSRTGPGGGAFVTALSGDQAIGLLNNLFLFNKPDIGDIFALRKLLEPELVLSLAGKLDEKGIATLQATIRLYDNEPQTAQDAFHQTIAELDFHAVLASLAGNQILGFVCVFLQSLLRDLTDINAARDQPFAAVPETGLPYQVRLVRLLKAGDGAAAQALMRRHLEDSERFLLGHASIRGRAPEGA